MVHEEPIDPSWIGKRVEYALVYVNAKGRESPLTEIARVDPVAPLPPPGAPRAAVGDGLVSLSWSPPPDAPASLVFSVHRRLQDAQEYPEAPLNPEPLSAPSFEDKTVLFGATSCYVVAAVLPSPSAASSAPSEEVCVTPEDRFAPPAPTGMVAVSSSDAILLSWRDVDAPGRKGYRVYRGDSNGPFELLAEVIESSYTDDTATPGVTYFYAVTAIDDAPEPNESAHSEVAEARRGP
jgi:fibronectin type 3 domain-containing protein